MLGMFTDFFFGPNFLSSKLNSITLSSSLNSSSAQVQILLTACRRFAMVRTSDSVPVVNKAERLSSFNNSVKVP